MSVGESSICSWHAWPWRTALAHDNELSGSPFPPAPYLWSAECYLYALTRLPSASCHPAQKNGRRHEMQTSPREIHGRFTRKPESKQLSPSGSRNIHNPCLILISHSLPTPTHPPTNHRRTDTQITHHPPAHHQHTSAITGSRVSVILSSCGQFCTATGTEVSASTSFPPSHTHTHTHHGLHYHVRRHLVLRRRGFFDGRPDRDRG